MKKNPIKHFLLMTIILSIITACSIEKRVHNKGYFVKWHSNSHQFHKDLHSEVESDEISKQREQSNEISALQENLIQNKEEVLLPEINSIEHQPLKKNELLTASDHEHIINTTKIEKFEEPASVEQILLSSKNYKSSFRADTELIINIAITVLLLALIILFIYLAIPATGTMVYVWWGLAAVCAIFFVTQIIDLILW